MSQPQTVDQIIAEIQEKAPNAKYIRNYVLKAWATQILEGKHESRTEAPSNIEEEDAEINFSMDDSEDFNMEDSDMSDQDEYGDIVTVKNQQFVVCSGLVVPQTLLKDEIIPRINEEMKKLGIDVEDVYNALMDDE